MKFAIQFFLLPCLLLCGSCSNKQKKLQPEATNDRKVAIIGIADSSTNIMVADKNELADRDTIIYEISDCYLWYTKKLPDEYKDQNPQMWTERTTYWEDVQAINVFVANPTNSWWMFGRRWDLNVWNGKDWVFPKNKRDLFWLDDGFAISQSPLLYCFCFPVGEYYQLPKGKYRLSKGFSMNNGNDKYIDLHAEFEIK